MQKLTKKHKKTEKSGNRAGGVSRYGLTVGAIPMILCTVFLLATLTACGNGYEYGEESDSPEISHEVRGNGTDEEEPEVDAIDPAQGLENGITANLEASMTTFGRNDVMISAGNQYVTWAELYYFIFSMVVNITGFFEHQVDWNEIIVGDMNIADVVLEAATENVLTILTYRYMAENLGISLSQEEVDELNIGIQNLVEQYGGREEFSRMLREEHGIYDYEVFENIAMIEFLAGEILHNELPEEYSDEIAADFAERNDFMMAKHILISATEDEAARNAIDEIYEQLRAQADDADFEDIFSEMMLQYSEDPGSIASPEGYLFQQHDMVEPFSNAAMELLPGEMSGVVETTFGFHIILRVPIDYDSAPIAIRTHSLRQLATAEEFEFMTALWREEMDTVFSELYDSIDIARIFEWVA